MKRIYIATLATALVLLSGCNKDNNDLTDIELDNTTDLQFIKLGGSTGAASAMTRASIESLDEMTDSMGIFCLAGRKTDVKSAKEAPSPDWRVKVYPDSKPDYTQHYGGSTNGRYWSNVCCSVNPEVTPEGNTIYRITPKPNQEYYSYYPTTSVYGYDFYGYYPYQKDDAYSCTANSVSVNITIDGDDDVIYGRSEKIDTCAWFKDCKDTDLRETLAASYYSARFFRKHPKKADDALMKLEHKLARFVFHLYPGPDKEFAEEKTYSAVDSLCVTEITINNVETDLCLVVADKSNENRNGTLYARNDNRMDFSLLHKGGGKLVDRPGYLQMKDDGVTPDTVRAGDCIMVLPGKSKHYMSVKLANKETGYVYPSEAAIEISFKDNTGSKPKTFEAGKTYNVYLQISSIKHIGITAELADWEESGEEMDLIEFN